MRISYRPLWVLLAQREMTKKELREISGISTASLAKLGKGENLTTDVLLKICEALNCNINEIIETVPVPGGVKLSWIEKQIGAPEDSLASRNPELCKPVTPPWCSNYELCVPVGAGGEVLAAIANYTPPEEKNERKSASASTPAAGAALKSPAARTHRISRGDTWSSLAAKYHCSAAYLAEMNGMKTSKPLKIGQTLRAPAGAPAGKKTVSASTGSRKPAASIFPALEER